ncbi:unnamed protein product [Heligmosomoides polygyrus]|uniref:HTH_48 domain-containing protein n=1 Tax=Heligmosomoides polygyrus TaxID=6339 RepID=A0A183G0V3_HELPZ|nr:unnamed protein product [Heligmosomoides polygyrus]
MAVRVCLLYDIKLRKSAAESHRSLLAAFGEDVVSKRKCERCLVIPNPLYKLTCPNVDTSSTNSLHDNMRPHVAKVVQQKFEKLGWTVLPHPPYSPDIAPSDYHIPLYAGSNLCLYVGQRLFM